MKIDVSVHGMRAVQAHLNGLSKQVAYAASRALNATGKAVSEAMPGELRRALDRPTLFTQRGVRVLRYANKARLETVVGFMDVQAKYMAWQIAGGARQPGREGLRRRRQSIATSLATSHGDSSRNWWRWPTGSANCLASRRAASRSAARSSSSTAIRKTRVVADIRAASTSG